MQAADWVGFDWVIVGRGGELGCSLGFEAAGLHAVAADLHVAPAFGVVFAGIEEEPLAFEIVAGAQPGHSFRGYEAGGALGEQPDGKVRGILRSCKAPFEA